MLLSFYFIFNFGIFWFVFIFSKERALETLLAEPGLQISSLEFLLGGAEGMNAPNVPDEVSMVTDSQGNKIFSLRTCECDFASLL